MTGILRVPRSRGALSGVLLVLLGAWGALIPFIGPAFHYAFTPDHSWTYTSGRIWLEVLPGAATLLGGLIVLVAATRPVAVFGSWLAAMSGAWFIVGRPLSGLWATGGRGTAGSPVGGHIARAVEDVGFFTGLGAVIIFFAAFALGRFTVVGIREVKLAAERAAAAEAEEAAAAAPATTETGPPDTVPADTVPADTVPADTVPADTAPASTAPAGTAPIGTTLPGAADDPGTAERSRLPRLPRRVRPAGSTVTDRPAGMTATAAAVDADPDADPDAADGAMGRHLFRRRTTTSS